MKSTRKLNRRSFLGAVAGGSLSLLAGTASAQTGGRRPRYRYNNAGRRVRSGITDGDKNPSDIAGPVGCTDHDTGRNSDLPQNGRGTRLNDNDRETRRPRYGDPANCGRRRGR